MERNLIIGTSGGIGAALAAHLGKTGEVVGLSRSGDGLDVTDEASIAVHLGRLDGPFDRIIVATGALEIDGAEPEKTLRALDPQAMEAQFRLNTIGPALVIKHGMRLLPRNRRTVLAVLSARVGSIGDNRLGGWVSYRAAKSAVNQVVRVAAIEMGRTHKEAVCVALHPGTVRTAFTRKYLGRHPAVAPEDAAENLIRVIDGLGPEDTGNFFDWAGKPVPW